MFDTNHVLLRNSFGNADNQWNFSLNGFKNSGGRTWWGNVDHSSVWLNYLFGLCNISGKSWVWKILISAGYLENGVEDGQTQVNLSTLAGRDSTNHISSIIDSLFAVESSLLSSETLADNFGGFRQFHVISCGRIGAPPNPNCRLASIGWKYFIALLVPPAGNLIKRRSIEVLLYHY